MTTYSVAALSKFLSEVPEGEVSDMLSSFSCKRDKDVESFLKDKAIIQEKKHISRTYLIFDEDAGSELVAYFTVAVSSMEDKDLVFSGNLRKKMNINNGSAQSYLIGQIGKLDGAQKGLGRFAIEKAIDRIVSANAKVGCRVVRVDCRPSLVNYYKDNGFTLIRQNADRDLNEMVMIL